MPRSGPPAVAPRLAVSVAEAAAMVGVSTRTLWTMIGRDELPAVKLGRRRVVRVADLERLLADRSA